MRAGTRLMRRAGMAVAAVGVVLMACSGPISPARLGARLPTTMPVHVDWLLLLGMAVVLGGGCLVQAAWKPA